jgi:predicted transcriptional regulator
MAKKPRYAKIAITIPEDDLAAADALARERDRSRSWVISEAVRRYIADPARALETAASSRGIGALRRAQLLADLRLTPEERVLAAERTARVGTVRERPRGQRVIGFDRYEDYLAWKRLEEIGG